MVQLLNFRDTALWESHPILEHVRKGVIKYYNLPSSEISALNKVVKGTNIAQWYEFYKDSFRDYFKTDEAMSTIEDRAEQMTFEEMQAYIYWLTTIQCGASTNFLGAFFLKNFPDKYEITLVLSKFKQNSDPSEEKLSILKWFGFEYDGHQAIMIKPKVGDDQIYLLSPNNAFNPPLRQVYANVPEVPVLGFEQNFYELLKRDETNLFPSFNGRQFDRVCNVLFGPQDEVLKAMEEIEGGKWEFQHLENYQLRPEHLVALEDYICREYHFKEGSLQA